MTMMQGLEYYNQEMLTMAQHWDSFIMERQTARPSVWYDRIPRGSYQLFNGLKQQSNIYRGSLPVNPGLATWKKIGQSVKPTQGNAGYDACDVGTPHTYSTAWETVSYEGYSDEWQSLPVCLNDLKFVDYAQEQLALNVKSGVEYGVSIVENWNREMYLYTANQAGRALVLCDGALGFEDNSAVRFTYDPFLVIPDADGVKRPYVSFSSSLKVSTLNWGYLDYIRHSLEARAGEASLSRQSGRAVFGLMIDMADFEKFVLADDKLRETFLYAAPQKLIDGYDMGMTQFRSLALIHDPEQARFRFKTITAGNVIATRVPPMRAGRAVTIGNVPEPNPAYYRAELAIGVMFMNQVLENLFVPSISNLGSGMTFGPAPGLTGEWMWINNRGPSENRLGETGNFYGRFQIFPKPGLFGSEATVFLYARCPQTWVTACEVTTLDSASSEAVALAAAAAAADYDSTNLTATVRLAKALTGGLTSTVSVKKANGDIFTGTIVDASMAPTYKIAWTSSTTNKPSAETDFTTASTVQIA